MILNKYLAGLLSLLGTILYALQVAGADNIFTPQEVWEIVGLGGGTVVAIFVPLTEGNWAAAIKVGGSIVVAVAGNVVGVLVSGEGWSTSAFVALAFAGFNALLVQLGVWARTDSAKQALVSTSVNSAVPEAVDPVATTIAGKQL